MLRSEADAEDVIVGCGACFVHGKRQVELLSEG